MRYVTLKKAHQQWIYFLTAIQFYSRIPIKVSIYSPNILHKSRQYFPLVGIIVSIISLALYFILGAFFNAQISLLCMLIASILLTGAFHEDGLADSFDAFGGGWNTKQRLHIMKDSRLGTYGVIALISVLSIKYLTLVEINTISLISFFLVFVGGQAFSRVLASLVIDFYPYVQDIDKSKIKPIASQKLAKKALLFSYISGLFFCFILFFYSFPTNVSATISAIVFASLVAYAFSQYAQLRIGGYTGDTLGATQQLSEIAFYLAYLANH